MIFMDLEWRLGTEVCSLSIVWLNQELLEAGIWTGVCVHLSQWSGVEWWERLSIYYWGLISHFTHLPWLALYAICCNGNACMLWQHIGLCLPVHVHYTSLKYSPFIWLTSTHSFVPFHKVHCVSFSVCLHTASVNKENNVFPFFSCGEKKDRFQKSTFCLNPSPTSHLVWKTLWNTVKRIWKKRVNEKALTVLLTSIGATHNQRNDPSRPQR